MNVSRYISLLLPAVFLVLAELPAGAGFWKPDPKRQFQLTLGSSHSHTLSESEQTWAASLANAFRRKGGDVKSVKILPRVESARVFLNGSATKYRVFEVRTSKAYLVYSDGEMPFLVDFDVRSVEALASAGTTLLHPHPGGRALVIVHSHTPLLGGIPVQGGENNPVFSAGQASWY